MKIYDITRTVSESLAVWPDDRPFTAEWSARMSLGSTVNVGAIALSTHAGTHVDAPLHFQEEGASVDQIPLDTLVGPVYVVDVNDASVVEVRHVEHLDFTGVPRVLFKTSASAVADDVFDEDFASIAPETIRFLADRGVVLVGTDAPSVDPFASTKLAAHHELASNGMVNLENLQLYHVKPGQFHLIALPLKIAAMDAAPVRAILLPPSGARAASH